MKLVLPPVYKISAVAACTTMKTMCPNSEVPKTTCASWEITVGTPDTYGVACVTCASQETPATSVPRIRPSVTSTLRAFSPSGGRNALTAFDTASMPVSDEPPLANARSSTKTSPKEMRLLWFGVTPAPQTSAPCATCQRPRSPKISLARPTMMTPIITLANRYVGHGERAPGLADAAQVAVEHQQDDADGDQLQDVGMVKHGDRRGHGRGSGGDLHGHGDHVVDQQRDRRDLSDLGPEVFPRDHVGAAGPGVDLHDFAVGKHDQDHDEQDHAGQRQDQRECRDAEAALEQLDQDFLGAVGGRGDTVRSQHAKSQRPGQALLAQLLVHQRGTEQAPLDGVAKALGYVVLAAG